MPQQCLYFLPLPQGQGSLRPTFGPTRTGLAFSTAAAASLTMSLPCAGPRRAGAALVPVLVMAYAVGSISGGAFNPAVAIGITVMNAVKGANVWIHLLADFAGGAGAAAAFKSLSTEDRVP